MNKKITILALAFAFSTTAFSQLLFSISTDFGVQRNFKKEQKFWAVGNTTQALFHLTPKDAIYVWFGYYTNGEYKNNITATAKDPLTIPQTLDYVNNARMRLKEFSVGWRKYFIGTRDADEKWNLYGFAGFGLILGRINNQHSVFIDTIQYALAVRSGKANFKRLTLDVGAGWEKPLGGDFFFFTELKAWIPATDYPSEFIFVNNNAPLTGIFSFGLRLLF